GDRRRRAFVDVGGPHVERDGADLERQAGEKENQPEEKAERRRSPRESGGDAGEIGRSGKAVEQRDSVKQDPARERSENEIFEAPLRRPLVGRPLSRQSV